MKSQKKQNNPVWTIISTIIYIILIAVLVFSLFVNFSKKDNEIVTFFGYAFAVVQSGSMADGGFNIGDMVIIKSINPDDLRKDDIIVFYGGRAGGKNLNEDDADPTEDTPKNGNCLTKITDNIDTCNDVDLDASALDRITRQDVIDRGAKLIFHRIKEIYIDTYGVRFYKTQGDSNLSADNLVREDFVVAKYQSTSVVLQSVFNFIATPYGLIFVVLIPILLMVIFQFLSFGKEIKGNVCAGKLLERKIRYKDIDTSKIKIENFLTMPEKVYLYDISIAEDKPDLAIILWTEGVNEITVAYNENRNKYYELASVDMSKQDKRKLDILKIKADIINKNPKITEKEANAKTKKIIKERKNGIIGNRSKNGENN